MDSSLTFYVLSSSSSSSSSSFLVYTFNVSNLEFEPFFEDSGKSSDDFVAGRIAAITTGLVVFTLGIIIQYFWTRRQKQLLRENAAPTLDVKEDSAGESTFCGFKYKNYLLISAIANSCLLGGLVFGFPGLVLILRKDGVYADVCSCGVFCAGYGKLLLYCILFCFFLF